MYVNTKIVKALLLLRDINLGSLCTVTGISLGALSAWLEGLNQDDDERLSFDRQLEVLKVLGIVGEHPRSDITHHWRVREPLMGSPDDAYEPLKLMLLCFGRAELVHLSPEKDHWVSFRSRTYFGLTFAQFRAVLEIHTAPWQSLTFAPEQLPNLTWADTGAALVLDERTFHQLTAPGEATPAAFDQERIRALEYLNWNRLTSLAAERGVSATEIASLLASNPLRRSLPGPEKQTKRPVRSREEVQAAQAASNEIFVTRDAGTAADASTSATEAVVRVSRASRKRGNKPSRGAQRSQAFVHTTAAPSPATHSEPRSSTSRPSRDPQSN